MLTARAKSGRRFLFFIHSLEAGTMVKAILSPSRRTTIPVGEPISRKSMA